MTLSLFRGAHRIHQQTARVKHFGPSVNSQWKRSLAVYALGEGWTGALGSGSLDATSPNDGLGLVEMTLHEDSLSSSSSSSSSREVVQAVSCGWGHTALIVEEQPHHPSSHNKTNNHPPKTRLLVCGRPHDFRALLRLKRLPKLIRNFAVNYSLQHVHDTLPMDRTATLEREKPLQERTTFPSFWSSLNVLGREEQSRQMHLYEYSSQSSVLPYLKQVPLPSDVRPLSSVEKEGCVLASSAGVTAFLGTAPNEDTSNNQTPSNTNALYTFGLNTFGQCGVGFESNNIWEPTAVSGLSTQFALHDRSKMAQEYPMQSVALGLQHAVALDSKGNMYSWGKGERGQLGVGQATNSPFAMPLEVHHEVARGVKPDQEGGVATRPGRTRRRRRRRDDTTPNLASLTIAQIAAGFNHSACLTTCNRLFVWGKNVALDEKNKVTDALRPIPVLGLPPHLQILQISCGSHHTAVLLEDGSIWGLGIATDNSQPMLQHAVVMLPGGMLDMPPLQFGSRFDRTVVVSRDGGQVWEMQLWSHEELQEQAAQEPVWMEELRERSEGGEVKVKMVEKGWLHTVVVTED